MSEKMIVFDVNGVLLKRIYKYNQTEIKEIKNKNIPIAYTCENRIYIHRLGIEKLSAFLLNNNVKYTFWSTMMRHNLELSLLGLKQVGFEIPDIIFCEEDCDVGKERGDIKADKWVKNLCKVAKSMNVNVNNCTLIDDNVLKSVNGQNSFIVKEMKIENFEDDNEIERIIEYLKKFIGVN